MGKLILMYHTANYMNKVYTEKVIVIQEKYEIMQKPNYLELLWKNN
jgi:hypothetical protein